VLCQKIKNKGARNAPINSSSNSDSCVATDCHRAGSASECGGIGAAFAHYYPPLASGAVGDPAHDYPFGATSQKLASRGYSEQEHFFSGKTTAGADYTSRMIVRKPTSAGNFSGTVYVEWLNVTNNYDLDALWLRSSEQILRNGDAYIGVSAQTAGVYSATGLKAWSPHRYSAVNIPTSGYFVAEPAAYDIFAQALQGIRQPTGVNVLDGLPLRTLIATGTSQSAGTMLAYSSLYGTAYRSLVDGYLIAEVSTQTMQASTIGTSLPLTAASLPAVISSLGVPVMVINTETDSSFIPLPETSNYRLWEVAGTTHVDYDFHLALAPVYERDFGHPLEYNPGCSANPYSRIPFRYAQNAAMDALVRWARTGTPAKAQPGFKYNLLGSIARDPDGNALGGVRLPEQDVPTATNRPENTGSTTCALYGQSTPYSADRLLELYPARAAYLESMESAVSRAQTAEVLLPADGRESIATARKSNIP
jgi:hypothetical protein